MYYLHLFRLRTNLFGSSSGAVSFQMKTSLDATGEQLKSIARCNCCFTEHHEMQPLGHWALRDVTVAPLSITRCTCGSYMEDSPSVLYCSQLLPVRGSRHAVGLYCSQLLHVRGSRHAVGLYCSQLLRVRGSRHAVGLCCSQLLPVQSLLLTVLRSKHAIRLYCSQLLPVRCSKRAI